jgi:hypothetical protein
LPAAGETSPDGNQTARHHTAAGCGFGRSLSFPITSSSTGPIRLFLQVVAVLHGKRDLKKALEERAE